MEVIAAVEVVGVAEHEDFFVVVGELQRAARAEGQLEEVVVFEVEGKVSAAWWKSYSADFSLQPLGEESSQLASSMLPISSKASSIRIKFIILLATVDDIESAAIQ